MPRRRTSKEADFASAIVGLGILVACAVYFNGGSIFKFLLPLIFIGLLITGVLIFRFRSVKSTGKKESSPWRRPTTSSPSQAKQSYDSVDKGFDLRFSSLNSPEGLKPREWSDQLLKDLDWKSFEELCLNYFLAKGRRAELTNLGTDGGADILLYREKEPDNLLGVVQCKAWTQKPVGVKEIRELFGVMMHLKCHLGVFVATNGFTPDAKIFAANKHIHLMSGSDLLEQINLLPAEVRKTLLEKTITGDYTTPSCPQCGLKLILREARRGLQPGQQFWGCTNYPRCRYTMRLKSS